MLELGCGNSPDALGFYLNSYNQAALLPLLVGVDHDPKTLTTYRTPSFYLLQADIAYLPLHTQFDLVISRHPDIDRHPKAWQEAFILAPDLLATNGILLVTVYSLPEFERIKGWLTSTKLAELSIATERLVPSGLQGRDRFILCWWNS